MTLFMPPIQRKKQVDEKFNPDTFRVISEHAVSDHPKYRPISYRASFEPRTPTPKAPQCNNNANEGETVVQPLRPLRNTRVLPQILPDHRANNPQTRSCGFLDRNVRFLNEPICNVYTAPVQHEEKQWWPARANPGELVIPPYAEDTHYRNDYNYRQGERPRGSGRHTFNQNREAARGAIPVNYLREKDGSQRFYKEGMSYEHMYNCRADPQYPIRGKRHGAFVWDRMDPISQKKFIEYYQNLAEQEQNGGPMSARKDDSPLVVRSNINNNNNNNMSGQVTPRRLSSVSVRSDHSNASKKSESSPKSPKGKSSPEHIPSPPKEKSPPPPPVIPEEIQCSGPPDAQEDS